MEEFPASDLCDVYKFCFQDVFGPAHIVESGHGVLDSAKCVKNIEEEIAKSKQLGGPEYQYTGCEGNYVAGANIAGFIKVADAMMAQGLV